VVDGYFYAYFFTDNTAYHGHEVLSQRPLPGLEAHISYNVTANFWASLDTNYCFRGNTVVDGVGQNDAQKNLAVGAEASWALNSRNSIALVFAKAVVHENAPAYTACLSSISIAGGAGTSSTGCHGRPPGGKSPEPPRCGIFRQLAHSARRKR
jgi:hypothetical protein